MLVLISGNYYYNTEKKNNLIQLFSCGTKPYKICLSFFEFAASNKKCDFNKVLPEIINIIGFYYVSSFVSFTMIEKSNLPSLADAVIEHKKIATNLFDRVSIILKAVNIESELQK